MKVNKINNQENSEFTFDNSEKRSKGENLFVLDNKNRENSISKKNKKDNCKSFVSKNEDNEHKKNNISFHQNSTIKNINNKNNNILKLDMTVNDEILPGETFNIQLYEDEKLKGKINNIQNILTDKIYINNVNINYLGKPLKQKKDVPKKTKKKIFNNLSVSSISTLNINSSYENIDEITSHKYITNCELRTETKKFLLEKCRIINNTKIYNKSKFLNIKNNSRNSKIYNSSVNKTQHFKTKNYLDIGSIKKTSTNDLNTNKLSYETLNNFQNLINKSEGKIEEKLLKAYTSNSLISINLKSKEGNSFDDLNENEFNEFKKKNNSNNKIRKKHKLKELDIISTNIQKSSQNLNQPDAFYAGLFNNLIIKDYPQLKETHHIFNNKDNNFYQENNNEIKEIAKKSELKEL